MANLKRTQTVFVSFCLCFALLIFVAPKAQAQVLYGTIVGNVNDATGAAVPGATVTIIHKETNLSRQTITSDTGGYSFPNVQVGTYTVKVSLQGFKEFVKSDVLVAVNAITRVDATLEVGEIAETVTVAAEVTPLQTDRADVRAELRSKEVRELPLVNYRNFQTLLNLVPGVTPGRFQNANTDTPARALTNNINGTARNNNNTRLDGALDVYIWLPHHAVYVPPVESIEEVNIVTNSFDAEQGMAGGAAITVITKSGTNEFHGSAFAFHDNKVFWAKNFFLPKPEELRPELQFLSKKPNSIRNFDGATLGGPVMKDKLFFFASWEGMRERVAFTRPNLTVPTEDQRRGDFSRYNTIIYDPLTGDSEGRGRTPFPGNIIPPHRINPIAKKMQDLIPLPNLPGTANNYFASGTQVFNRDNADFKLNWNRTSKHQVWGRYSFMDAQVTGQFSLGEAGGPCLCDGGNGTGDTFVQVATIGHTWTLTPKFLWDGTFGFTRMGQQVLGPDFGQNFGLDVLGIPGTNGPDIRQSGKPQFAISGYTTLGNVDNWSPIFRKDQSFTGTTNFNLIRNTHDLRWGFDVVRHHLNHWQPEIGAGPRGQFNFGGGVTALNGGPAPNQFNAYAQFLLGLPNSMQKSLQWELMTGREWQFAYYFRDRWQATRNLTLTLGLRYEYYPLMTRANRGIELLDLNTMQVKLGGLGGNPKNLGINVSKKLFAPRVGFAYRIGNDTVIRAGYGITYSPMPFSRPLRGFYPLTIAQDFVAPNPFVPFRPIEQGIPEFTGPDLSKGVVDLPPTVLMRTPYPDMIRRGYIQSWNLVVERKLPQDFVVSVGYVGTQTVHQLADLDINAAPPGGGTRGQPLFARFGRTAPTLMWDGWLSANYHSLQATINRRFTRGLFVKGAYTFSKAINWTDDDGWAGVMWNHPSVLHRNRARAGYDIPHIFQLGFLYELPFGRGKKWANAGGVASALLGGWQINGIFSSFSGRPFTVFASGASLNAPGNSQTADQVKPKVEKLGGIGRGAPFYDPTAFAPVTEVRFGSTGRNILRAPGAVNLDLSVFRKFQMTERLNLEFRAEFFNFTNTPHFGFPQGNVSVGGFMTITSTDINLPERRIRFGLRLGF